MNCTQEFGVRLLLATAIAATVSGFAMAEEAPTAAESALPEDTVAGSDRLLLTGGVSEVEGAAGGGLTPWAVIGGYGTDSQIGANAFLTRLTLPDYHLDVAGALVGFLDRVELSYAQQRFDTEQVGAALGLGQGYTFTQDILGVKLRLVGDAVLDQDRWLPQISVGAQFKKNDRAAVLQAIGAKDDQGVDFYLSATKLYLSQSLLANLTLRFTKANQIGILGFGGDLNDSYEPQLEGSIAWLVSRNVAIGAEYRMKPDNLSIAAEDDWFDAFVAWAPNKHLSLMLAYANLGSIVNQDNQDGIYASLQVGF
ncbi:DUF3034 family protein [Dokdonella sp.]|uniref:DUF3034 family protein n=1 Tax=Dokdonella sp. TaxID=2291710 RepID=UPI0035280D8B